MEVIAIGTLKGGTGKTNLTFNIGGRLAENSRVLIIDIDPQANLTINAGLDTTVENAKTVRDILESPTKARPEYVITKAPIDQLPNLDIIASHIRLTAMEVQLVSRAGREFVLSKWIKNNREFLEQYDYILIDTNPSMSIINQNAFVAADSIILISDVSEESKMGAMQFVYLWDEIREAYDLPDNVKAMVLNNVDIRMGQSEEMIAFYREDEDFQDLIVPTYIPYRASLKRTSQAWLPINVLDPKSDACKAVCAVVDELREKGVF